MESFLSSSNSISTVQERKGFDFPPNVLYENRYCNQDDFSVLVCGGKNINSNKLKNIFKLNGSTFECEIYASILNPVVIVKLL